MLRKILATGAIIIAASACISTAKAQSSRVYFASYLGLNTSKGNEYSENATPSRGEIDFQNTGSFAGALGLRISPVFRLETELSYRNADITNMNISNNGPFSAGGNIRSYLLMLNAYYDFDLEWEKLSPFVTAGVGLAYHNGEINDTSGFATDAKGSDIGLAYQVGGGLKYRWSDDLAFTGGYRFLGGSEVSFDTYDMDYSGHEIRFGLEYDLPVDFLQ